MILQAFNRKIV